MQTNSAFDAIRKIDAEYKKPNQGPRDYTANHYYWFGAENIPSKEVPGGRIARCRVTPVVRAILWDHIDLIPMEMREPGYLRDFDPIARKFALCGYVVQPGYIAEQIEEAYGASKANPESLTTGIQGVVELTPLRGWDPPSVEALEIDNLFFPEHVGVNEEGEEEDLLPKTYTELRARIKTVQGGISSGEVIVDPKYKKLLVQIGDLMLASLDISEVNDQLVLDATHACFERSKNDRNEKSTYDARDFRALKRLEQVRRDHALAKLASQHNNLQDTVIELLKNQGPKESLTTDTIAAIGSVMGKAIVDALAEKEAKPKK